MSIDVCGGVSAVVIVLTDVCGDVRVVVEGVLVSVYGCMWLTCCG